MEMNASLEKMEWKARFGAGEYMNAGSLALDEAERIAKEIERRINKGWARERKNREAAISISFDNLRQQFLIRVEVVVWGNGRISDNELGNFTEEGKATALALLNEVLETLKLAKRMALIKQALEHQVEG